MLLFIIIPTSPGKLRSLTTCQINAKDLLDHKGYAENIPETDKQMLQENFEIWARLKQSETKTFWKELVKNQWNTGLRSLAEGN